MKMARMVAVLGVALATAGCVMDSPAREAGNWKLDRKLAKFEMPGMPPEVRDELMKKLASTPSNNRCLTQEEVDKEEPLAALTSMATGGSECTWSKMTMVKGKVDMAGACTSRDDAFDMTVTGTVLSNRSDFIITINGKAPVGEVVVSMTDVHTGPCLADGIAGS